VVVVRRDWRVVLGAVEGRTLRSEELAGDVEGFAADDDDFLAVEQLFGDGAGEAAEEVAFAVYHDLAYMH
jgi:hypothetical protein